MQLTKFCCSLFTHTIFVGHDGYWLAMQAGAGPVIRHNIECVVGVWLQIVWNHLIVIAYFLLLYATCKWQWYGSFFHLKSPPPSQTNEFILFIWSKHNNAENTRPFQKDAGSSSLLMQEIRLWSDFTHFVFWEEISTMNN